MPRRVVITGIGLICPLGNTKESLWEGLSAGRSAVRPLSFSVDDSIGVHFGAEAWDFTGKIEDFGVTDKEQKKAIRKQTKVMCRECQFGVAAAQHALTDAGLAPGGYDPERTGVTYSSDYMLTLPEEFIAGVRQCLDEEGEFEFDRWAKEGMPKMSPLWLLKYLPNMPASHIAIFNDLRGPNNSLTLREASPNVTVGEAYQTIMRGSADILVTGATGTRLHPMKMVHTVQQEEVADTGVAPEEASRPFDRDRTGMVLGEGAGAMIFEELASAEARGAKIYGEVIGSASSSSAGKHLVAQRGRAMENVLRMVLANTGTKPEEVGHLHAHGLSTRSCDVEEAGAIQAVFGDRAEPIPVVAAKSYFGNLGAGGGMVEMAASVLALGENRLFATLNYQTPDPDCPVNVVTEAGTPAGECFVNLNVSPQGQAGAVLIRRFT